MKYSGGRLEIYSCGVPFRKTEECTDVSEVTVTAQKKKTTARKPIPLLPALAIVFFKNIFKPPFRLVYAHCTS
jgi:hypothetical protein